MCTLTWWRDSDGVLEVYFNRDELKTRPVADPPAGFEANGRAFLSPRDPRGGGTWMLANEAGLVVCLLNKWEQEEVPAGGSRSRGRLVWNLAGLRSAEEVGNEMVDLKSYRGFTLVAFSRGGDRCFEWDGKELTVGPVPPFLTSSSYRFDEVRAGRLQKFARHGSGRDFHASPGEPSSAYTVRMNRPDAQTWSRSQLRVSDRVSWRYLAEQADLAGEPEETVVALPLR